MLTDDQIRAMLATRAARAEGIAPERILERALRAGPTTRQGLWRPALRALGGLAVAAAIVGLVILGGNLSSAPPLPGGVGASGSASPSPSPVATPVATPVPSPTATPAPTPTSSPTPMPACDPAQLAARILDWQGAAGSRIADVRLTDVSATACKVPAIPGLQFLDAKGGILIASAAGASSSGLVTIGAGASLTTAVEVTNYCGSAPSLPVTIAFLMPDGGRVVATALENGAQEGFAVPPCNGVTGAVIAMNGWQR